MRMREDSLLQVGKVRFKQTASYMYVEMPDRRINFPLMISKDFLFQLPIPMATPGLTSLHAGVRVMLSHQNSADLVLHPMLGQLLPHHKRRPLLL